MLEKKRTAEQRGEFKKKILEYIPRHHFKTTAGIAKHFEINRWTLWKWRKDDPAFELAFDEAMKARDRVTAEAIESKWKLRLMKGNVSGAEMIFYLTNAMSDIYKDRRALIGSLQVGASVSTGVKRLEDMSQDDLISATKAIITRDNL